VVNFFIDIHSRAVVLVFYIYESHRITSIHVIIVPGIQVEKLPNIAVTDEEILDQLMPWSDSIPENLRSKFQNE
jgi:hypothetical protein